MALDFYKLSDLKHKTKLFSLEEIEADNLNSIFIEFEKITSIHIDRFANTRIYPENIVLILKLIDQEIIRCGNGKDRLILKSVTNFRSLLQDELTGVLIVGD